MTPGPRSAPREKQSPGRADATPAIRRPRSGDFPSVVLPHEMHEAIVTNDVPVFNVVENRLLPAYLGWMCRTASFVEECKRASEGTTNRVRLQEDKFPAREIPLPPLAEQRRVVARIEELAAEIHEAQTLRHQSNEEAE